MIHDFERGGTKMKTKTEYDAYVIKDNNGFYAGSIIEGETKNIYSYSTRLRNGFYTYPTKESVEDELEKLQNLADQLKFDKQFHIEKINLIDIMYIENQMPEEKYPIKYEYFKKLDYFIKDDQDHFAHANSIKQYGCGTWVYISHKTFSPVAKGYISRKSAKTALAKLNKAKEKMGLDVSFHLEYLDMDELCNDYGDFVGENMMIIEKRRVAC